MITFTFLFVKAAQVALRRQQQSSMNPTSSHLNSVEYIENIQNLLAQKRAYQKQLKCLQQSSYSKFNKGT